MTRKLIFIKEKIRRISGPWKGISKHHVGPHAAQAAFFFVLSLMPLLLLLMTMIRFIPVTQEDMMFGVEQIFPSTMIDLIESIITQAHAQSNTVIPVTIIIAMWSAAKGVLAVISGLNDIYHGTETRNFLYLRIRAILYTLIFLIAIILSLVVFVFGNSIRFFVHEHLPFLGQAVDFIVRIRMVFIFITLITFWTLVYKFLPDRKKEAKMSIKHELPGAVFTAGGWLMLSFVFSIYLDVFTGFSTMHGSLTTIILLLLWLYLCMYTILLGGEINMVLDEYLRRKKS